jgi:threonylcarbamoyladenosine tRNA methylthiotransferase MtaB
VNSRPADPPSVAIHTHGCKLNQADSGRLARQFRAAGYRLVDSARDADVFVLNTCTITAAADAKARQALRAARRTNPRAIIVATGCYSQRAGLELNQLDAVSLVVGNTEKDDLLARVAAIGQETRRTEGGIGVPVWEAPKADTLAGRPVARLRAMIKIQEGCNQVCAYCIVPRVRGRERSISPDLVIDQVNQHVSEGGREVVLTGTQLGTYGFDLPATNLVNLLKRLLDETRLDRLRVSSLQAQEITPELLALWEDHRLCPHFHVPLQNGCDRILRAMRRRYDTARFAETAGLIRQVVPDAAITTDLIVGFPGEGEIEFKEGLRFADSIGFSDIHVFPYSVRPGTSAAYLANQVSEPSKGERVRETLAMSRRNFLAFRQQQSGQVRPVLWQTPTIRQGVTRWSGLTDNYVRVCTISDQNLRNTVSLARLGDIEIDEDSVRAEVI